MPREPPCPTPSTIFVFSTPFSLPSLPKRHVTSVPSQLLFFTQLIQGDVSPPPPSSFGACGRLPSVVYISVAPSGISTLTLSVPVNNLFPTLTTGAANRSVANCDVAFVASGVGVAVQLHSLPPSDVRAHAVRLKASGYSSVATTLRLLSVSVMVPPSQSSLKGACVSLILLLPSQMLASQAYPEAMSRTAWARQTDGGEVWGWTADATPGATNATASFASTRLDAPVVNVGSKLFSGSLNIKVNIPEGTTLMYTTDGSLPRIASPWKASYNLDICRIQLYFAQISPT